MGFPKKRASLEAMRPFRKMGSKDLIRAGQRDYHYR